MIADKENNQKWYGNGKPDASQGGNPNGGVASETQGRLNHAQKRCHKYAAYRVLLRPDI
jgi:hypothetical protein